MGIINILPSNFKTTQKTKGKFGALLLGMFGGIFSSPCSTPVLIVILAYVADKSSILLGIVMLFLYSMGHSLLVVIAGTSVGFTQKIVQSNRLRNASIIIKYTLGILVIILGIYILSLVF
jgi:cytochrome c biogenesis protein CcdA